MFHHIRILYWTTLIGRHGKDWNKERQREEGRKKIKEEEFTIYDQVH
jgi:hypothetical protein